MTTAIDAPLRGMRRAQSDHQVESGANKDARQQRNSNRRPKHFRPVQRPVSPFLVDDDLDVLRLRYHQLMGCDAGDGKR